MTDDLAALLEHLNVSPVYVIGWSDAGIETLAKGVESGAELLTQLTGHEDVTTEQPVPDRPTYVPSGQSHFVSPEAAAITVYVAIRGLYILYKKLKKKK